MGKKQKFSTSLLIKKMLIKPTMRYYCAPTVANIKSLATPSTGASLGGSAVKNPPAMQEMRAQSLGREDPLEKEMATHFSMFAWEITWREETGGLQFMGLQKSGT